jgi:peptidoglycan/LPS O-acetylase OafA/YrhL
MAGSLFFIPMINPNSGLPQPVVEPGWTLNYEMFFYRLFAVSLTAPEKWRFWLTASTLAILASLSIFSFDAAFARFYTNPILLEFLFGMAIAVPIHLALERPIIAYFASRKAQSDRRSDKMAFSTLSRQTSKAAFKTE